MLHKNSGRNSAEITKQFDSFKQGDGSAFNYFFQLYNRPIYLFIFNLLHSETIAEEITDDVFILLWNDRDRINDCPHLVNFLYLVARRQALSQLFRLKKQTSVEAAWARYHYEWATQFDEVEMIKDKILSLIFQYAENLPAKQKEVFLMSFSERMDVRSIAQQLGTSEKNVYKHLSKAYEYFVTVFPQK